MFPCISGLCVKYQSCWEFHDLSAHQISVFLDLCAKSYGPNIASRPAEKQTGQSGRNCIFLPTLTVDLALELNTKVVV